MPSLSKLTLPIAALFVLAIGVPSSAAPSPALTLNLQGGRNLTATACGAPHHYTAYSRRGRVPFNGTLAPPPGKHFIVKVKIKKCVGRSFRAVTAVHVKGNRASGHFDGSATLRRSGYYFARAYYYGVPAGARAVARSDKQYFRLR